MNLDSKVRWAGFCIRLLGHTWRPRWENVAGLEAARSRSPGRNIIFAIWHNSLATLAWTHRHRGVSVLVSQHDDGEWIARILVTLGFVPVRGSSSRGGLPALLRLGRELETGHDVALTVDGPLGPRYEVHPGVLLLARRTGCPVVPVLATARHRAVLGTWDALRLPLPGSEVLLQHGEPVWIAPQTTASALEQQRLQLRAAMHALTAAQESRQGHQIALRDIQDLRSSWERWSEFDRPPAVLRGLSQLYRLGAWADRHVRRRPAGRGQRPWVVGIGNLEAGGTGKTPVLLQLVQEWWRRGVRCAVLTRGHGGALGAAEPILVQPDAIPASASDETRLMRLALPDEVPLVVSRRKHRGLQALERRAGVDIVLVDDALQSAHLCIDRHLVLLDAQRPLGNGHLLPAGRLRESPRALRRADVLLFTRAQGAAPPQDPLWSDRAADCFVARETPGPLVRGNGEHVSAESLRGSGVATLCGIGKPAAFEDMVRQLAQQHGFELRRSIRVADHAAIDTVLRKLRERMPALACSHVIMTRKDACRLPVGTNDEPLLVLEQRLEIEAIDDLLCRLGPTAYSSA